MGNDSPPRFLIINELKCIVAKSPKHCYVPKPTPPFTRHFLSWSDLIRIFREIDPVMPDYEY